MTLLWTILSKKSIKTELSSQNYVDPEIKFRIFLDFMATPGERDNGRPAVHVIPKYIINNNLRLSYVNLDVL